MSLSYCTLHTLVPTSILEKEKQQRDPGGRGVKMGLCALISALTRVRHCFPLDDTVENAHTTKLFGICMRQKFTALFIPLVMTAYNTIGSAAARDTPLGAGCNTGGVPVWRTPTTHSSWLTKGIEYLKTWTGVEHRVARIARCRWFCSNIPARVT